VDFKTAVRYFALTDRKHSVQNPYNIFREFRDSRGLFLQHLDPSDPNHWIDNPTLAEFTIRGESGATEITEDVARRFVESRGGRFSPPDLQP
jgi:hypothetical protein